VGGVEESRREINLAAGGASKVSFTIVRDKPGVYRVDINGQAAGFTVVLPPTTTTTQVPIEPPPVNNNIPANLILIVGVGVVAIAGFAYLLLWRRRA